MTIDGRRDLEALGHGSVISKTKAVQRNQSLNRGCLTLDDHGIDLRMALRGDLDLNQSFLLQCRSASEEPAFQAFPDERIEVK